MILYGLRLSFPAAAPCRPTRSAPAVNAFSPAPVTTPTQMSSRWSISRRRSEMDAYISMSIAFIFSGRLRVIVATRPLTSNSTATFNLLGLGLATLSLELNVEGIRWYGGAQLALAGATRGAGVAAYGGIRQTWTALMAGSPTFQIRSALCRREVPDNATFGFLAHQGVQFGQKSFIDGGILLGESLGLRLRQRRSAFVPGPGRDKCSILVMHLAALCTIRVPRALDAMQTLAAFAAFEA